MTRPEIEALLEGAYFHDRETREAVIKKIAQEISLTKIKATVAALNAISERRQEAEPLPKGPAND